MTLTADQRLLLTRASPGRMIFVLLFPDNDIPLLRQSNGSGCWPANPDLPDWFHSYDITPKGIAGGRLGEPPHVFVTWKELRNYALSLTEAQKAILRAAHRGDHRAALTTVLCGATADDGQLELFA